jgi:16S rRNA (adenine1518-N6/adenine1519-N6)-dimethyltransferase
MSTHIPTLKQLTEEAGMRPSKSSGQHFLVNEGTLARIVSTIDAQPGDHVLEFGAGFGTLTFAMANAQPDAQITAVERDVHILPVLRRLAQEHQRVTIVEQNILEFMDRADPPAAPWILAANLPYGITGRFLRTLFDLIGTGAWPPPRRAVLLLQSEVVDRLTGKEGSRSMLTMLTELHASAQRVAVVPRTHFWPPPKVKSAVVVLDAWRVPEKIAQRLNPVTRKDVIAIAKAGFASPRKQLITSLKTIVDTTTLDAAFRTTGMSPTARPATLTLDQWIAFIRALHLAS